MADWYKREPIKFIDGTMNLELEEKGAYSLCIDLMHIHGGTIPDDARWLAGICNVSIRKWHAIRKRLLDLGKLDVDQGRLSNFRATFDAENLVKHRRELAERGARGGRQRAENEAERKKNNGLGQAAASTRVDKSRVDKTLLNSRDARAKRLPDEWKLPDKYLDWATGEGWQHTTVVLEADKFHDYWISASGQKATKRDWFATWRNWMRNVPKNGNGKIKPAERTAERRRAIVEGLKDAGRLEDIPYPAGEHNP